MTLLHPEKTALEWGRSFFVQTNGRHCRVLNGRHIVRLNASPSAPSTVAMPFAQWLTIPRPQWSPSVKLIASPEPEWLNGAT